MVEQLKAGRRDEYFAHYLGEDNIERCADDYHGT
jgi:hypothetical protein